MMASGYYYQDDLSDFDWTRDGRIIVYTDGSCLGNGRNNARAGIGVYFGPDNPRNASIRLGPHRKQTNNVAEICAAIYAIRLCAELRDEYNNKNFLRIDIRTDSEYLKLAWQRMPEWEEDNWIGANGRPIANRKVLQELENTVADCGAKVRFVHVPAHSGHVGNECADELAYDGAEMNYWEF